VATYCYVAVCRRGGRLGGAMRFGAHRGRRGAGHIVAAARLYSLLQECEGISEVSEIERLRHPGALWAPG